MSLRRSGRKAFRQQALGQRTLTLLRHRLPGNSPDCARCLVPREALRSVRRIQCCSQHTPGDLRCAWSSSWQGQPRQRSAFLTRELPRFDVESRRFTTCFPGGAAGCGLCTTVGPSRFTMETRSAWRVEVPSPYLKSSFQLLQRTPLVERLRCWNLPDGPASLLTSAPALATAAAAASSLSKIVWKRSMHCLLWCVESTAHALHPWSSTLIPDVVPGDVTSSWLGQSLIDTRGS